MRTACAILALLTLSCGNFHYPHGSIDPGPPARLWMVKRISGGRQCRPGVPFTPPDVVSILQSFGFKVYRFVERGAAVCRACSCPSYSADHFVQIDLSDEDAVSEAYGFRPSEPPPRND